jgi:hypothetical protein
MVFWRVPTGPKTPLFRVFKYFNRSEPEKYGGSLMKNLISDAPELAFCIAMFVAAFGICGVKYKHDFDYGNFLDLFVCGRWLGMRP